MRLHESKHKINEIVYQFTGIIRVKYIRYTMVKLLGLSFDINKTALHRLHQQSYTQPIILTFAV